MGENIKDQLEIIDRLMGQKPQYKEVLGVYRQLVELMNELSVTPGDFSFKEDLEDMKREEGFPLFSRDELPIDLESASNLLSRFMEMLIKTEREDRQGLMNALEKSKEDPEWSIDLFKAILREDKDTMGNIANQVGLDPNGFRFLAQIAMRPSMEALRTSLSGKIDTERWDYGYCPLCGSKPNMAYFAASGKRYLHCELCGMEWSFQRIGCPFCDNHDHEKLGYLEPEQEEGFRVYFCKKCLRYIKTVDKRAIEETAPMVLENLVTLHLDLLAVESGFK